MDPSQMSRPLRQSRRPRHLEDFVVNYSTTRQQIAYAGNMSNTQHAQGQVEEDAGRHLQLLEGSVQTTAFAQPPPPDSSSTPMLQEELGHLFSELGDMQRHFGPDISLVRQLRQNLRQHAEGSSNEALLSDRMIEERGATLPSPVSVTQRRIADSQLISSPRHHTSIQQPDSLLLDVVSPPSVRPLSPAVTVNPPPIMPQSPPHPHSTQASTQPEAPQPSYLPPSPEVRLSAAPQPQSPHGNQANGAPQPSQGGQQAQAPDHHASPSSPSSAMMDFLERVMGELQVMNEKINSLSPANVSRPAVQGNMLQLEQSPVRPTPAPAAVTADVRSLAQGPFAAYPPQAMAPQQVAAQYVPSFQPSPVQRPLQASYGPSPRQFMDATRAVGQPSGPLQWPQQSTNPSWLPQPSSFSMQGPWQPNPPEPRRQPLPLGMQTRESTYKGPKPTIPDFVHKDPSEFARLKIALENLLPADSTELFKYQILVDHLLLEEARLLADSYLHSPTPYTHTMGALNEKYGQPHQLALSKIATVMDAPDVRRGDFASFERFALQISALVGMLRTLGPDGEAELHCGSHVSRLLSKLPVELRATFRRQMGYRPGNINTLIELSEWLQHEVWCQDPEGVFSSRDGKQQSTRKADQKKDPKASKSATVLHSGKDTTSEGTAEPSDTSQAKPKKKGKFKAYCPYCDNEEHFLSKCAKFQSLSTEQRIQWIREKKGCWRCGRAHQAAQCTLKKPCGICQKIHLQVLHEVNQRPPKKDDSVSTTTETLYLDQPRDNQRVLLKVIRVLLHHGGHTLDTYAVLDDGSERTILLSAAAERLALQGSPEKLSLRTIRQDVQTIHGSCVSFSISSAAWPRRRFQIKQAFTAKAFGLAEHSYPMEALRKRHRHLQHVPLTSFEHAKPLLLIGADHPHLITPIEPVRLGPPGGPAAVRTKLGWVLQGPASALEQRLQPTDCLWMSVDPVAAELQRNVEKLWQLDALPPRNDKLVTRSREDQDAIALLETKTVRVDVAGVLRYATPLLRRKGMPTLQAKADVVMPQLRSTERRLAKNPERAQIYNAEVQKLVDAGYVVKLQDSDLEHDRESWFIPHHLVEHNGKHRIVFNCSFQNKGLSLNEMLLPGPTLGPSLLGVLLRFRQHATGISGDIKGMFHQVRLLPEDRPLLRFVWREGKTERTPTIYEWQVLPFGTTCSPCCATYALQRHMANHCAADEDVRVSVEQCFYVDNCLQSTPTKEEAKHLLDKLRALLAVGGFEIRQWASNEPSVIEHLPGEARSDSVELWLAKERTEVNESTLGLRWDCNTDVLGYKHRPVKQEVPTLRHVYRVLASQYDPLGYILPFTTRAKVLVQRLWDKKRQWDDPLFPDELLQAWNKWVGELPCLSLITMPRCYVPAEMDHLDVVRDLHVFCDASERAYGSVAYLRSEDQRGRVVLSFLMARSRVAPRKQHSMPRLELCAALTGAQLAKLLKDELTFSIQQTVLWSDSTTVLNWLQSESCRFKVFVGTRVSEIQELTSLQSWRYVESSQNPADDLTRGKSLEELAEPNRWSQGPPFLLHPPDQWPARPPSASEEDTGELRKPTYCGVTTVSTDVQTPDISQFSNWQDLLEATAQSLHGAANGDGTPPAECYKDAETLLFRAVQVDSFPDEYRLLKSGKSVPPHSRLLTLAPEFDPAAELIRVGGRLRRAEGLEYSTMHPIVLDPKHPVSQLLIQDYDSRLCHPGPERVFAEMRRTVWILRAREAIRRQQFHCSECRRWKAKPAVPKMADLPPARLRLHKPPFHSTGMDCFGPFQIKVGRRNEKRWGIIFKCLTTRGVHLDVLTSIDVDAFLMALRRFIARRGKPAELHSDQGTNFKGGEKELKKAFADMSPDLQQTLAKSQIAFHFNPPAAPHFGGAWEREIRSVKAALATTVGSQPVTEEVLRTVLVEVECILNSKPLGYVSSNVADPDPVTPNLLLMGRPDSALPQIVYPESESLSRRRWRQSQIITDHFWSRFIRHYLPTLQTRQKWHTSSEPLADGQVVMMMDPQLPRAAWPIGRIVKVFAGPDGLIRTAEVKIKDRSYTRPVARLVVLPEIPEGDPDDDQPSQKGGPLQ